MAEITVDEITEAGLEPTYVAANGGGDHFIPDNLSVPYLLHVKNGGAGAINTVVNDPNSTGPTAATAFNADLTVAVPASEERLIRIPPGRFVDPDTGQVDITYSGVTSVTVAAYKVATSLT